MSFAAKFAGKCLDCGDDIEVGQIIARARMEKGYVHLSCPDPAPVLMVRRPICGNCRLEVAANGSCECE